MIEKYLLQAIKDFEIAEGNVFLTRPTVEPSEYILIKKISESNANKIVSSTFAIESISEISKENACEIAEDIIEKMSDLTTAEIHAVSIINNIDYTNPKTKKFKYQTLIVVYWIR